MLFAASAFMSLLHKGHLVQLEGDMITWFWPEIVQDFSLLQIASAANKVHPVSRPASGSWPAALQFFSTLAAPYGQPADGKATAMGTHVFYRYVLLQRYLQAHAQRKKPSKAPKCRFGAKHISKSKRTKHQSFGALLEVAMSKKCTPLWREAHFQVNMYKAHYVRTMFGS